MPNTVVFAILLVAVPVGLALLEYAVRSGV